MNFTKCTFEFDQILICCHFCLRFGDSVRINQNKVSFCSNTLIKKIDVQYKHLQLINICKLNYLFYFLTVFWQFPKERSLHSVLQRWNLSKSISKVTFIILILKIKKNVLNTIFRNGLIHGLALR